MDQPPPPPAAASAPSSGLCTSAWLEQVEPADPAAPGHAAASTSAAAAAAAGDVARAPSSGWSGFLTNTAFDVLLERKFRTEKALSRRQEQLDDALQKLDASERRAAELERRVVELEATAAQAAEDTEAALADEKRKTVQTTTRLVLFKGAGEGAVAKGLFEHGAFRPMQACRIPGDTRAPPGTAVLNLPPRTDRGTCLWYVYDEPRDDLNAYVRVGRYSCKLRFQNGVLGCLVPNYPSKGGDTPSPTHWESIMDMRNRWKSQSAAAQSDAASAAAQSDAASAAAPSELKKRSAPDAASALAVSKAKKRVKVPKWVAHIRTSSPSVLGPLLTTQEARAILQEYGPHGGRGGLYKIARYHFENSRANVFVNTETGVWIVIDWDLTIRATSSHFLENEHAIPGDAVRKKIFRENGYSNADYDDYMLKMHSILLVLAKLREQGYCDIVIVTRNDCRNVEAGINTCAKQAQSRLGLSRPSFSDEDFPIIAFPENGVPEDKKKDKAQLLAEHVPQIKSATRVVFVDDSHGKPTSEHDRFAASARDVFSPETEIHHVLVTRCPRYAVATKRGRKPTPYGRQGLGNQVDKLNEIAAAITSSEHPGTWAGFAKDHLGLRELVGHEGVFAP